MAACFGKCFNGRRSNAHQWEQQIQESSHHHSSHHSSPIKYPQTKERKMSVVMEGTNEMSVLSDKGSVFSAQASVRGAEAASFDDRNLASTSGGAYSIVKHSDKKPAAALQEADANAAQQSAGKRTLPSQLPATRSAEDHERNDTPQSGAATQEAASQQAVETPAGRGGEGREGEGVGAGGGLAQIPRLDLVSIGIPYTDPETIQKQRRDSIGSSILSSDSVFGTHRSMGDGMHTNRSNISTRKGQSGTWNVAGIPQSVTIASLADPSPGRLSKQATDLVVSEGRQHSHQKQDFLEQKLAQRTALVPLPSTATAKKNMEVSAQPTLMLGSYKKEAVGQPKPLAVKPLCVGGALGTRGDSVIAPLASSHPRRIPSPSVFRLLLRLCLVFPVWHATQCSVASALSSRCAHFPDLDSVHLAPAREYSCKVRQHQTPGSAPLRLSFCSGHHLKTAPTRMTPQFHEAKCSRNRPRNCRQRQQQQRRLTSPSRRQRRLRRPHRNQ
jgi:hypothetical protein